MGKDVKKKIRYLGRPAIGHNNLLYPRILSEPAIHLIQSCQYLRCLNYDYSHASSFPTSSGKRAHFSSSICDIIINSLKYQNIRLQDEPIYECSERLSKQHTSANSEVEREPALKHRCSEAYQYLILIIQFNSYLLSDNLRTRKSITI